VTNDGCPGDRPREDRADESAEDLGGRDCDEFSGDRRAGGGFGDDGGDEGDVDDGFAPGVVRGTVHTVCHLCGGMGEVADPVLAVRGGAPFTVNPGRPCTACDGEGHLPGLQPPV
jgi:hypothetical protein